MANSLATPVTYLGQIWRLRRFWFSLVCNDVVNRYRRSFLGIGWSLLRPLCMTVVLCFVFGSLFDQPTADYAPYLMLGIAVWQYVHESVISGSMCFVNSAAYIRQQKTPLAMFSMRTALGSGFHFLIAFSMAVGVTLYFRGLADPFVALFSVLSLGIVFVVSWSAATVVGLLQTRFRDTGHLLEIGLQILFYMTPIVYRPENLPHRTGMSALLKWNPVHSLLLIVRQPILEGTLPPLHNVVIAVAFASCAACLAWACLRRLERTLVFWL